MRRRTALTGIPAACLLVLAVPGLAHAGTAAFLPRPGTELRDAVYTAAPGELNRLTITVTGFTGSGPPENDTGTVRFRDSAGVTPGAGCIRPNPADPTLARCDVNDDASFFAVRALLRDRDDTVAVSVEGQRFAGLDGGAGADVMTGGAGGDTLDGGPGDDTLSGRGGLDELVQAAAPDGADVLRGGAGFDSLSYGRRTGAVSVDRDGRADDGAPGEADLAAGDIERVAGGRGPDRLTGGPRDDQLRGAGGRDVLRGGRGDDGLSAGGGRTADVLFGGRGDDVLGGSDGANRLVGGPGRDELLGRRGNDSLLARDGFTDVVSCGRGGDRARLDRLDFIPPGCERRTHRRDAAAVVLRVTGFAEEVGGFGVRIGCPIDGPPVCRGVVDAFLGTHRISRDRFAARAGRRGFAGIAPRGRDLSRLDRPGGRLVRVVLVTRSRLGRRVVRRRFERLSTSFP